MKKTYKMFLAFVLCLLGAMNVTAGERIPFDADHFTFKSYSGWGADATETGSLSPNFKIDEVDGCPIGDTNCNAWVDLTNYSKMYIKMAGADAEGNLNGTNPRIFINRTDDNGQFNADKASSKCLVVPNDGTWAADFYTKEADGTLVIDLKAIAKEWGFVHFHSIKGSAWNTKAVVYSIEVEQSAKAAVGYTSVIKNGDFEGSDFSSFVLALKADSGDGDVTYPVEPATEENVIGVTEGAGKNGSKGLVVKTMENAPQTWSTQLFVKFNEDEPMTEGLQWRFSMDVKADVVDSVTTGSHAAPRAWIDGGIINKFEVTSEWNTIKAEGTITKKLEDGKFGSIAFDLNNDKSVSKTFYFDNITFEVFKLGTVAEFNDEVLQIDFGFETNISDLVKATGKKRLLYPVSCVSVKVNGEAKEVASVEAFEDGCFYIFFNEGEGVEEDDEVVVSFTNPTDAAYQVVYASGTVNGQVVKDFADLEASFSEDVDAYSYDYLKPTLVKADPEDGSFNLPNSIKEFKAWFDKEVKADKIEATLNGEALTVTPNTGLATEFTFTRTGGDLATGEYSLRITKAFPKADLNRDNYCDTTMVLNVGKPEYDPNDVMKELIPAEYFANCAANVIPEGFKVTFQGNVRESGSTQSGGPRMFDFAAGGDFTKGLYFREGYVEYGTTVVSDEATGTSKEYALELEVGKKYEISFNTAMWKDNGSSTRFQIFNKETLEATTEGAPEALLTQVVSNKPNMNGGQGAVNGSTKTVIKFVPQTTAKYVLRWVSSGSETGDPAYMEALLGNPSVKYIPNQTGIEWIQLLETALTNAKSVRDANVAERYAGTATQSLNEAIEKYEAEKDGYTNPSAYQSASDNLNSLADAVKNHRNLCDDYDAAIKKGIDVVRKNELPDGGAKPATKFVNTELFAELKAMVNKYNGTSEWHNVADTIADPEAAPVWELAYSFDVLVDDAQLTAAIAELKEIANKADLLFTEGESTTGDTGVRVLVERIRRGANTLRTLGVSADDELYKAAINAFTDDEDLVEAIKTRIKTILYEHMKTEGDTLFNTYLDDNFNEVTPEFDMSVFAKNPNIYKVLPTMSYSVENVPGWEVTTGNGELSTMWRGGTPHNVEGVAEDVAFTKWHGLTRMQQTITDLPVGVYTVVVDASEWSDEFTPKDTDDDDAKAAKAEKAAKGFVFVKTSATPEPEPGLEEDREANFAKSVTLKPNGAHCDNELEGIVVADGVLTIGVNFGPDAQYMFDQIKAIKLTAPATGVNYAEEYNKFIETGIEPAQAAAKVRAIEVYDLNGMRMTKATRGLNIVKKYMSDGSVRIQKVIVK